MKQGNINNCKSLVRNIKSAANEYVSDNRYNFTDNDVVTDDAGIKRTSISAETLVSGNYLSSPIINPFDKTKIEPDTISIEIILNKNYTVKETNILAPVELEKCIQEN